ncbi:Hsp20/alpha crystallin family protein [Candidatus Entotheonella palauensis]|uniref:SHSP domain-containing protein n=1 Tax=Candidatus Entotheonella gemina TaxID=1429439 RepID=W4LVH9_9BACT|nr:Hsp20/alpha crystallin family protein [Candidatus Entotheonella palauensis]ETX01367.1 MAG: hypothetical protein ETSY2_37340 [Candidatus Entotheonella gemina]
MIQHTVWKEFDNFCRDIENMFHGLSDFPVNGSPFTHWTKGAHYPTVRLHQDEEAVVVEAVVPGVNPDSLALSVEDNTLIIAGDKPKWAGSEKAEANGNGHDERTFKRSIELPVKVDVDQTTAACVHGVLRVTMPKAQVAKARKIEVAVS